MAQIVSNALYYVGVKVGKKLNKILIMTDKEKLEKIKELADAMYYAAGNLGPNVGSGERLRKTMGAYHEFIIYKYHKEEPVSNPIDFEKELYKAFGQVKDFTLGMRIAKRFYEIGRNYQEPISEDLEEAAREYAGIPKDSPHDLKYCVHDKKAKYNAVLYGANWKKQQMERYRIEHCNSLTNEQAELEETFVSSHVEKNNRIPTFIDAIEYGIEYCKQQMMAKAVDVTIAIPYQNGYGGYTQLLDSKDGLPFGDKLKVLVIKED